MTFYELILQNARTKYGLIFNFRKVDNYNDVEVDDVILLFLLMVNF